MKFNWGTGITIFFIFFATSMILAVVATSGHPPQLVQKDYYTLDLNYQERLEKKQNAAALASQPAVRFDAAQRIIEMNLPEGMTAQSGTVHCYRSASAKDDVSVPIENLPSVHIPAQELISGRWHLEVDWTANGKKYFWETVVYVN